MTNSISYRLNIPAMPTKDSLSKAEFDDMMEKGLTQAKTGEGLDLDTAFKKINESI